MDLQQIKVFVRVAELGSFTQAAHQLGQAKGQTSQIVGALENSLGMRLLVRTSADRFAFRPCARCCDPTLA
jgi:DNA-binding transcriptional LysR family regulator